MINYYSQTSLEFFVDLSCISLFVCYNNKTFRVASKLYGVNATILIFVFVLYCIVCCIIILFSLNINFNNEVSFYGNFFEIQLFLQSIIIKQTK